MQVYLSVLLLVLLSGNLTSLCRCAGIYSFKAHKRVCCRLMLSPLYHPVLGLGCAAKVCAQCNEAALVWLQESGLARVLLPELGLETVMRINRPARPGDTLQVCVGFVDVPKGVYTLNEVDHFASTSLSSADLDDEEVDDASSQLPAGVQEPKLSHDRGTMAVDGEPVVESVATATPQ